MLTLFFLGNKYTMNKIIQRLKSKTYRVGMLGLVLTAIEINSGIITGWLPADYRPFAALLWPLAMFTLREMTTEAIGEK